MKLSIIIPVLNDGEEVNLTIKSIRETTKKNEVEIIVVDDGSDAPVKIEDSDVRLFRFNNRIGAGQARHFGATVATSKLLLFTDSHMRFDEHWYNIAIYKMLDEPKTLWCCSCLGLDEKNMNMKSPYGVYTGADFVLYNKNTNTFFDGVWKAEIKNEDDYEISCVMGACYFIHRDWYFHIRGLEKTTMWGSEEPILSIKTWLSGGTVKIMKSVKLGHKFRNVSSYVTDMSHVQYNKLAYMYMILPDDMYDLIKSKFPNDGNTITALNMVEKNKTELDKEKEYYKSIFVYDVNWFIEKFKICLSK